MASVVCTPARSSTRGDDDEVPLQPAAELAEAAGRLVAPARLEARPVLGPGPARLAGVGAGPRVVLTDAAPKAPLPGVAEELERRRLREECRALASTDPPMARSLRVGRPDLPRNLDDGGYMSTRSSSETACSRPAHQRLLPRTGSATTTWYFV